MMGPQTAVRPARRRRALPSTILAVIAAFGLDVSGALETPIADASASYGEMTITGAVRGTFTMSQRVQCEFTKTRPWNVYLFAKTTHAGSRLIGDNPSLVIYQLKRGASGHAVNLAKTKDYTMQFIDHVGNIWASGWGISGVRRAHIGSGTLSASSNGKSGSVRTVLLPSAVVGHQTNVHFTAAWHCA